LEKVGDIFGFLADVCTDIFTVFVDINEFFEGFDDVDVISEIEYDVLRTGVKDVVQKSKGLNRVIINSIRSVCLTSLFE
jgi:hypothetical protein